MSYELMDELQQKMKQLDVAYKQLRKSGIARAEAERDYKIALSKKGLMLREEGMAVGMIEIAIYGTEEIAALRFKRDTADVVYKANQECINCLKLEIKVIDNQINREWSVRND